MTPPTSLDLFLGFNITLIPCQGAVHEVPVIFWACAPRPYCLFQPAARGLWPLTMLPVTTSPLWFAKPPQQSTLTAPEASLCASALVQIIAGSQLP